MVRTDIRSPTGFLVRCSAAQTSPLFVDENKDIFYEMIRYIIYGQFRENVNPYMKFSNYKKCTKCTSDTTELPIHNI